MLLNQNITKEMYRECDYNSSAVLGLQNTAVFQLL